MVAGSIRLRSRRNRNTPSPEMSDSDDLGNKSGQHRYATVSEYVTFLFNTEGRKWSDLYDMEDELTFPERLVLIHPRWYNPNTKITNCGVRGRRRRDLKLTGQEPCDSIKNWDYECPFDKPKIMCDHIFPWSLGGPSLPNNTAYLCQFHNLLKGPDIHHLELNEDNYNFGWFPEILERVRKQLR